MKKAKRFSVLVLSVMICLSLLPLNTVIAAEINKSIVLGTESIKGGQSNNVYFGHYKQSSLGSAEPEGVENIDWVKVDNGTSHGYGPYYSIDPIKWRVLSKSDDKAFLFSDKNLDEYPFNQVYGQIIWGKSTMRSWLNGYDETYNNCGISYVNNNFISSAFSAKEITYIADTVVKNDYYSYWGTSNEYDTIDKVFLLSIPESQNPDYGFDSSSLYESSVTREAKLTEYIIGCGHADNWWLRNPGSSYLSDHVYVQAQGWIMHGGTSPAYALSVRPAINLDISSALFASAAKGGKPVGFNAVTDYDGIDWKLTVKDDIRINFEAKASAILGNDVVISYQNALTGPTEYISAIIKNGDNVKYYGRLGHAEQNGTISVTLPNDFDGDKGDTLCIFNEQYNGDCETDYASELIELSLTDINTGAYATIEGYTQDKCAATIKSAIPGTYMVIFADYENKRLSKIDMVEYTFTEGATVNVEQEDKTFKLGKGDKVMLWNNGTKFTPLCSAFTIE